MSSTQSSTGPESESGQVAASTEVAELEERWLRALADLDNVRKRFARELARERQAERMAVAAAWLPVLDNLDAAVAHAEADSHPIVEGVRAIRNQALDVMARLGFPRQDDLRAPFDPARHEVVSVEDDPEREPGTVVRVLRAGYGEGDRLLRPAAVAVNRQAGG